MDFKLYTATATGLLLVLIPLIAVKQPFSVQKKIRDTENYKQKNQKYIELSKIRVKSMFMPSA